MKNRLLIVALILAIATAACGGPGTGGGQATELPSLVVSEDANFGGVALETGFMPDPQMVRITSGGEIDVEALGLGDACTGYATRAPDFRIAFTGPSDTLRIFFVADDGEDATLIINDPNGAWICNDDASGGGWDPLIELRNAASGQYDIWVGSFSAGEFIAGTLYITELNYSPNNLP